jgi:PAS domain S-box-containing protein
LVQSTIRPEDGNEDLSDRRADRSAPARAVRLGPVLSLPVLATLAVLGLLLALDLSALAAARRFDDAVARLAGEARLQSMLDELPPIILDMESGVRGYLLTGERTELGRYRAASARLPEAIEAVAGRAGDDGALNARLREAQELSRRWLDTRLSPLVVKRDAGAGSNESMREIVRNLRGAHGDPLAERIREELAAASRLQVERVAAARAAVESESDGVANWMRVRAIALLLMVAALALLLGRTLVRLRGQTTSRETAERKARESSAALQGVNDATPLGMFSTDSAGILRQSNAAFERMTGLAGTLLAEPGWQSALHPDDRDRVGNAWKALVAGGPDFASEHRFLHRNGNVVWVSMKTARITDAGRLIGHVATVEDVTERRNAEEALRRSEERLQLVLENAQLALFDWHLPSGEIVLGRQWHALAGGTDEPGPMTARRFAESLHPDDREALREALVATLKGRSRALRAEFRVRAKPGPWKRVLALGRVTERDALGRAVQLTGTLAGFD